MSEVKKSAGKGRLVGKVAIITGGAGGCGAAASRLFAAEGVKVIIIDLNADAAINLAAQIIAEVDKRWG